MAQSNIMGKLVDRAGIIRSGFSELEKTVIKATKHNTKAPKPKHVRRLLVYLHEQRHRTSEIIDLLARRLEVPDWIVVMKTLNVFHQLLRDSRVSLISELRYRSSLFNLRRFEDMSTAEAHHQSVFIRKYSQYIEEKVLVFKICSLEFEKDPSVVKSFTNEEFMERIPRLQSQLNALLNCRASKDHINNNIIASSFTLLLKDSFKLHTALNEAIISLLEKFFNMNVQNAEKALEIYKLYTRETEGINQFFDISRKFSRSEIPELEHAPTTFIEALENYIEDLKSGKNPNPNADMDLNAKKSNMKKIQKQMDNIRFDSDNNEGDSDSDDEKKDKDLFSFDEPKPAKTASSTSSAAPTFDPFGNNSDFFASDPFGSSTASPSKGSTGTTSPSTATSAPSFDPFDSFSPSPAPTNVPYDAKKKQIEMLMTTNTGPVMSPQPLQPTKPQPTKPNWAATTNPFGGPTSVPTNNPFHPQPPPTQPNNNPFFTPSNNNPFA